MGRAIPEFNSVAYSAKILKDLDKQRVLVQNCNRDYEGEIKNAGDTVKIRTLKRPTVNDYDINGATVVERLQDEARELKVDVAKYVQFVLDKIEDKQSNADVFGEAVRLTSESLGDSADEDIASLYTEVGANQTVTEAALTSVNFISTIAKGRKILMKNNVKNMNDVVVEISPDVYEKLLLSDIAFDQNNTDKLMNGEIGQYLGMKILVSNSIVTSGTGDTVRSYCFMRTKRAIGYAEQIVDSEQYMPETGFGKGFKSLHVYGKKILAPKELVLMDLTNAAESTI